MQHSVTIFCLPGPGLSIGPDAEKDDRDRFDHDLEIQPQGPVVQVFEVELHPVLEPDIVPSVDLPQAGDPRLHGKPASLPGLVFFDLIRHRRTGADEAHVAEENVEKLGQLVEAELPHDPAERRDPLGLLGPEFRRVHLVHVVDLGKDIVGALPHRPELVEGELPAVEPEALLLEEYGTRRGRS